MGLIERFRSLFRNGRRRADGSPRILAYCASNIGLGPYCRLMRVLEGVRRTLPEASILLATDAREHTLAARNRVAVVQLPRFRFTDQETFKEKPELLAIKSAELRDMRAEMILALGQTYRPNLLLLDANPHGKRDEVLPLLRRLRQAGDCRALLLMRDIPAPPGEAFKLNGDVANIRKHAALYDRLLLAGDAQFFDAAAAYGWPEDVRRRAAHVGFVIPAVAPLSRAEAFAAYAQLDPAQPTVLVSFGGGWQAEHYAPCLLDGLEVYRQHSGRRAQLVMALGMTLPPDQFADLRRRSEALGGVVVEHFSTHFSQLLPHVDLAILQAGSVPFQILETDLPLVLTHRPFKSREQQERAQRLARWPGIRLIEREAPDGAECADWLEWGLTRPRERRQTGYCFEGVTNAAREIVESLKV